VHLESGVALRRAATADHGVLATLHPTRGADLVPVCFAIEDGWVAIPIDAVKPKRAATLGRVRNLERDPRATLLLEGWDAADWSRLWWVRLGLLRDDAPDAVRTRLETHLRARYPQYATAPFEEVLAFRIDHVTGWSGER
jgi:hypothetical protein